MVMKTKEKFVIVGVISFCMQSVFAAPIEEYFLNRMLLILYIRL